jgi:hypothetical protein
MAFALQQLRIRIRIYVGFGVLVALAADIGTFGANRLTRVDEQVQDLGEVSSMASHIQDATLQLETVSRAATRYPGNRRGRGAADGPEDHRRLHRRIEDSRCRHPQRRSAAPVWWAAG